MIPAHWRDLTNGAILFLVNLVVAGRLLVLEYSPYWGSTEPVFFAFARVLRQRFPDLALGNTWWAGSNLGYPLNYYYQPLLHLAVAGVAALTGWTEAHAYHATVGIVYAAGPVSLYALLRRLQQSRSVSLSAGVLYSLVSPAALLLSKIAADVGGRWLPARLHAMIMYGDAPNIAGLTLLPLAILFLDRARERRTRISWAVAAIVIAAVPLTNFPASIALAWALVAYWLACEPRERWTALKEILLTAACGFLLFAPWLSPSVALRVVVNTQEWMDQAGRFSAAKIFYYAAFSIAVATGCVLLHRLRAGFAVRFSVLFLLLAAPVPLLDGWNIVTLIAQALRFHVAMEMPVVLCAALVGAWAIRRIPGRPLVIAMLAAGAMFQAVRVYQAARTWMPDAMLRGRPESEIARWMKDHAAPGERVFVEGSVSLWLNELTHVPQVLGCCDQNHLIHSTPYAHYLFYSDDHAGEHPAAATIAWMQVLGVRYVAVNGPKSVEVYKPWLHPFKLDGALPERWRSDDDVIYEVPGPHARLVHAVRPKELPVRNPIHGLDLEAFAAYRNAITDETRPQAKLTWESEKDIRITGELPKGFVYSLQVPYHEGWRADGAQVKRDPMGFLVVSPSCDGPCDVHLHFSGGTEYRVLNAASGLAWLGLATWLWRGRSSKKGRSDDVQEPVASLS